MAVEATKTVKDEFRESIELVSEGEAANALGYVRWLLSDEEELTEEELAEARAGIEKVRRGDYVTQEGVERRLAE